MSAFNEFNDKSIAKLMNNKAMTESNDSYGDCGQQLDASSAQQLSQQSSQASQLNDRMPVSELQEFCAKSGINTPEYRLCRTDGNAHSPLFTFQVLINDVVIGEGVAKSKKLAKHSAAQRALTQIKTNQLWQPVVAQTEVDNNFAKLRISDSDKCDSSGASLDRNELQLNSFIKAEPNEQTINSTGVSAQVNAVSILHEICAKNGLESPVYNQLDRQGSCHEPIFWFSCHMSVGTDSIIGKASAKTKQLAKRASAEEVLKMLKQKEIPLSLNNNNTKKKSRNNSHQNDPTVEQQKECRECLDFMESLQQNPDLDDLFEANDTDYCLRLSLIAEKLSCKLNYIPLQEEQSKSHKYKCLLQLTRGHTPISRRLPVFVSWGNSPVSADQAMQKAAQKAIIMVKVLKM